MKMKNFSVKGGLLFGFGFLIAIIIANYDVYGIIFNKTLILYPLAGFILGGWIFSAIK